MMYEELHIEIQNYLKSKLKQLFDKNNNKHTHKKILHEEKTQIRIHKGMEQRNYGMKIQICIYIYTNGTRACMNIGDRLMAWKWEE